MSAPDSPSPSSRGPRWLRRADQAVVAALVLAGLGSSFGWWLAQGGGRGRLLELERAEPQSARYLVDLNAAQWPELAQLPGVGPVIAQRIVEHRRNVGPYRELSDLRQVKGIGPTTYQRLEPFLRPISGSRTLAGP